MTPTEDSPAHLQATIKRYNEAWNADDLDATMSMHAPDMTFETPRMQRAARA